jgi:hypothetical protein
MLKIGSKDSVANKYPLIYVYAGINSILVIFSVLLSTFDHSQFQNTIHKAISHSHQKSNTLSAHQLTDVAYISLGFGVAFTLAINLFFVLTKSVRAIKTIFIIFLIFSLLSLIIDISKPSILGLSTTIIDTLLLASVLRQMRKPKSNDPSQ